MLSLLGAQVRSPVGELRFHKLRGAAKKTFFKNKYVSGMLQNKTTVPGWKEAPLAVTCYIVICLGQLLGAEKMDTF